MDAKTALTSAAAVAGVAAAACFVAQAPAPPAPPPSGMGGRTDSTPRLIREALADPERARQPSPEQSWTASEGSGHWEFSRMGAATWVATDPEDANHRDQVKDGAGVRDISALSVASEQFKNEAALLARKLEQRAEEALELHPTAMVEAFTGTSNNLAGCIFVGHTNTDMDSVASAIAGAELYDGIAARSAGGGDDPRVVNGEILHALAFASLPLPPFFQDLPDAMEPTGPFVCFVDTNHPTQMIEPMPSQQKRIKGCIDHHNSVLQTATPIFLDIRPWGSCCSILAHNYIRRGKQMSQAVARILLCGILSDTINLMSPTTTDADRIALVMLSKLARVDDLDLVAQLQFRAKTASFVALSPFALVQADMKCFQSTSGVRFAWATVEVTDVEGIYAKAPELIGELRLLKEAKEKQYAAAGETNAELPYAFLSIVNLSTQTSQVLLCGGRELCLAHAAFQGPLKTCPGMDERRFDELAASPYIKQEETMMDLGSAVSRKLEFVPPVMALLDEGWVPELPSYQAADELPPLVEQIHLEDCADGACLNRTLSSPRGSDTLEISASGGLPALGLVTREQRAKAKARPPPPPS